MDSTWSVDAIHRGRAEDIVRLVKYHPPYTANEEPYTNKTVGMRYLHAEHDAIARSPSEASDRLLDFGRSFHVKWKELAKDGIFRLTVKNLGLVKRDEETERALLADIRERLDGAEEAEDSREISPAGSPVGSAEIHVLKVGQGDTILVKLGNGIFWLIDAYSWQVSAYKQQVADALRKLGCNKLQGLVLSHFHLDHVRRAAEVIRDFDPDEVLVPNHDHRTASTRNVLAEAGARLRRLNGTAQVSVGDTTIEFAATVSTSADPNERAILCYCESPKATALLAADVPAPILIQSIQKFGWKFPRKEYGTFYKVTHHCSATGKDRSLLETISPTEAATSCGLANRYRHPDQSTRDLVEKLAKLHTITSTDTPPPFQLG